jgi:hypothetical protein
MRHSPKQEESQNRACGNPPRFSRQRQCRNWKVRVLNFLLRPDLRLSLCTYDTRTISAVQRTLRRLIRAVRIWISAARLSRCDARTQCLLTPRLCRDPAPWVVSRLAFPDSRPVGPRGQGFASDLCRLAVCFPRPTLLADRYNRGSTTQNDDRGQQRLSSAPSAVTLHIFSSFGIWSGSLGRTGAVAAAAGRPSDGASQIRGKPRFLAQSPYLHKFIVGLRASKGLLICPV